MYTIDSTSLNNIPEPGRSQVVVNFYNGDPGGQDVRIVSGIYGAGYTWYAAIPVSTGNSTVPVAVVPCGLCLPQTGCGTCMPPGTTADLKVWLTPGASYISSGGDLENTQKLAQFSTTVNVMGGCSSSTTWDRGCIELQIPSRVYIATNVARNLVLPINTVMCGVRNNITAFRIGLRLWTDEEDDCITQTSSLIQCSNPPTSVIFFIPATTCSYTGTATYLSAMIFEPGAFPDVMIYDIPIYASYLVDYPLTIAPNPFTSVNITPGANATAKVKDSVVELPANVVPAGISASLYVEVTGPKNGSATDVTSVDVVLSNGSALTVYNLSVPITITFPITATNCKTPVCHYWNTTQLKWQVDGCNTLQNAAGAWLCSCTHATDFSMLLLDSSHESCASELSPHVEGFYVYAAIYILLGAFAFYSAMRVIMLCNRHFEIIFQHLGVFIVCVLRTFLSLYQTGIEGSVSTITMVSLLAVPRLLEFALFSFIAARWGAILHFSMGNSNPFKKIQPYFIAINVVAAAIVIYIFVAFAVSPSYDAAIVGEALSAFNGLCLSVGFAVYAAWLDRQFSKIASQSHTSGKSRLDCGPRRLVLIGSVLAVSFVAQGVFACLSLAAIPRDLSDVSDVAEVEKELDVYNALYRLFNIVTLVCILIMYYQGVKKIIVRGSEKVGAGSFSGSKTSSRTPL